MYGTNNIHVLCVNIRPAKNLLFYEICAENEQKKRKYFYVYYTKTAKLLGKTTLKIVYCGLLRKFIVAR